MAYTVNNNSPSAGYISWTDVTMVYDGVSYSLANGNTMYKYTFWRFGETFLRSDNVYPTLTPSDCVVFINTDGVALSVLEASVIYGGLIVPGTITAEALAVGSITADKIAAGAITADKIEAYSITADHIKVDSIDASRITANTITSDQIKAGSIEADSIDVTDLFAQTITATGTITGATLQTASSGQRVVLGLSGIQGYDNTPEQRYELSNTGSGWLGGTTVAKAIEWTAAGATKIAGWTATNSLLSTSNISGTTDGSAYTTAGMAIGSNGNIVSPAYLLKGDGSGKLGGTFASPSIGWSTAGAVTVAGWNINATTISSSGGINLVSGATNTDTKIYIGTGTYNNANTSFFVDGRGYFSLEDKLTWDTITLTINGTVNATAGLIGNATNKWTIGSDGSNAAIHNGKTTLADTTNAGIFIGTNGISLGSAGVVPQFSVTSAGYLTSTSGKIANWTLASNQLYANDTAIVISATGTIGTITGAGTVANPWLAVITLSSTTGAYVGAPLNATNGTGSLYGGGGYAEIVSFVTNASINYKVIGGTTPTAGTITAITIPAIYTGISNGTLPSTKVFYSGATDNAGNNAKFLVTAAGEMTSTAGTIAGWSITPYSITSPGTAATGYLKMVESSYADGGTPFYSGVDTKARLKGYSYIWVNGANAGHLTLGQMSSSTTAIRANFYGLQMRSSNGEHFALGIDTNQSADIPAAYYCRIGGWSFDTTTLSSSNVSGTTDGTTYTTAGMVLGSTGYIAAKEFLLKTDGSALFKGTLSAPDGTIGSFTIGTHLNTGSKSTYNDDVAGVHVGSDGIGLGSTFKVSAAGAITATSGAIGGWNLSSSAIYYGTLGSDGAFTSGNTSITLGAGWLSSKQFYLKSDGTAVFAGALSGGTISIGSGNSIFKADSNGVYLGNATFASAPFRVTPAGALTATNATITGAITANSGSFADGVTIGSATNKWTIGTSSDNAYISYNRTALSAGGAGNGVYIGVDGISLGTTAATPEFKVTSAGAITSTSGTIGGFTLGTNDLYSGTGATRVQMSSSASTGGFWAGADARASAPFSVTQAGALTATNATITGTITANSGTIGGFTVNSTDGLYSGTTTSRVQMKAGVGFWAGADAQGSAPFSVTQAGALTATNATITGSITATGGTFGSSGATSKWNIGADGTNAAIYNGKTSLTDAVNAGIFIGTNGISMGSANNPPAFTVTSAGVVTAKKITAELQSCSISAVSAGNNVVKQDMAEETKTVYFSIGGALEIVKALQIAATGTLRATFQGKMSKITDGARFELKRGNGTVIATFNPTTANVYETFTQDITLDGTGDIIQLGFAFTNTGFSATGSVKDFQIKIAEVPGILSFIGREGDTGTIIASPILTLSLDETSASARYISFSSAPSGTGTLYGDSGLSYIPSTGVVTAAGFSGALTGNASSATILATARNIAGVSFDGSANISIPFANLSSIPTTIAGYGITDGVTLTGTQTITNKTISGSSNTLTNIGNGSLTNSSITIGATSISLGGTTNTLAGLQYIQSAGNPASWGVTNGVNTGALNAVMGTGSEATWLLSGTSGGVFRAGIQVLDTNGTIRFYSNSAYVQMYGNTISSGVWNGSAISDTYLSTISTAGKVSNSATTATTTNTNNAIVTRGASGEFSAGAISAASLTTSGNITVGGELTVNGTTTTINATTITVDDKNIELGSVTTPTNTTADQGGITLKGATDKTIIWDNANANWTSSEHWNIVTDKTFKINNVSVLSATALGSSVVSSSLTSLGILASHLLFTDNSYDIGASGATRPRTLYAGTSVISPTISGSVTTANNLTIRANTADLTTGQVNITSSLEASSVTVAALTTAGGLGVSKRIWATDLTVTNLPTFGGTALTTTIAKLNYLTSITGFSGTASGKVAGDTAPIFVTSITTPSVLATANDSGALGASGTAFSDLFLASGGVINWSAGNATLTHSTGLLTSNVPINSAINGTVGATTPASGKFTTIEATNIAALTTIAESWVGPSSTNGVYFKSSNVGIGTNAPLEKLSVIGNVAFGTTEGKCKMVYNSTENSIDFIIN